MLAFPYRFFIYEVKRRKFCMSMSDHIKQQAVQEILSERSHSPGKRQNWILLFY